MGTPQAVLGSKDLRSWHLLLVESLEEGFNHNMLLSVSKDVVACSTGKTLLVLDEEDVENALTSKPVMVEYSAYWERLVGYGFSIKHNILDKF